MPFTLKDELPRLVGVPYAKGEEQRNNFRKNEKLEPKQKQCPVVDVSDGELKAWCFKEYCIRTWNVMSMNQGKLEAVKQEMARVNTNILKITELKWMGMGEFNSDEHYIYCCRQESLRRNGVALIVNRRIWNILVCNLKNEKVILVCFQGNIFNLTVTQVYIPTTDAEETEIDRFCKDLQDLLELTKKKKKAWQGIGMQK